MIYRLRVVFLIALFLLVLGWATNSHAKPIVAAIQGDVTVTLTDEKCKLKAVSNMPNRAVWRDSKGLSEGCFQVRPEVGLIVAYFDDGAVALIPMAHFKPVEVM